MKSKHQKIKDVLERHFNGNGRRGEYCAIELMTLFEMWNGKHPLTDLSMNSTDSENTEDDCFSDSLASDNYNDDEYGDS